MTPLHGKVALITGAGGGLGGAIANLFAEQGASVAIADINKRAAEVVTETINANGGTSMAVTMDVTDESAVTTGTDQVVATLGRLDILISNAGVQLINPIEQLSYADWKKVLATHLDGAFLTTRAALRHMYRDDQGGTVIYMGSVHSHLASPLKAPYITAKHGLLGLARTLAREGAAHQVRSHVICPGFVNTPLVEKQIPEQAKKLGISQKDVVSKLMLKDTIDGAFTTLEDVAQTALYLATFPSAALSGQSIVVSHGWFMQ